MGGAPQATWEVEAGVDKEAGDDDEGDEEPSSEQGEPGPGPGREDKPSVAPVAFVREVLGEEPYRKQVEILKAVAEHRRVSVVGCNAAMIEQVSTRRFYREGERIKLQDKFKLSKSPDEADALAMTFAVRKQKVQIWV